MNTLRRTARAPKRKFAGSMGGEGRVTSRYTNSGVSTGAAQTGGWIYIDPPKHSVANDPGAGVIVNYSNYRVLASRFIYVPAVGTTTTGTMWAAYIDNPEVIKNIVNSNYSLSTLTNIAQNSSKSKAVPIWEPLELSMTCPPRRRLFSVDTDTPSTAEQADRAVQGLWLWVTTAAPLGTALGVILQEYTAVGENLQPTVFTGV